MVLISRIASNNHGDGIPPSMFGFTHHQRMCPNERPPIFTEPLNYPSTRSPSVMMMQRISLHALDGLHRYLSRLKSTLPAKLMTSGEQVNAVSGHRAVHWKHWLSANRIHIQTWLKQRLLRGMRRRILLTGSLSDQTPKKASVALGKKTIHGTSAMYICSRTLGRIKYFLCSGSLIGHIRR